MKESEITTIRITKETRKSRARLAKAQALLDHYFGDGWKDPEFEASEFDTCDSINTSNGLAKLFREALKGAREASGVVKENEGK